MTPHYLSEVILAVNFVAITASYKVHVAVDIHCTCTNVHAQMYSNSNAVVAMYFSMINNSPELMRSHP